MFGRAVAIGLVVVPCAFAACKNNSNSAPANSEPAVQQGSSAAQRPAPSASSAASSLPVGARPVGSVRTTPIGPISGLSHKPGHSGLAGLLAGPMPPAGQVRTHISGCLAARTRAQAQAEKSPDEPRTRAAPMPAVGFSSVPGGIVVTHKLRHACCLHGKVTSKVEGKNVQILETLSGTPCRCMCGSTIQARVGLQPGKYSVTVKLETGGSTKQVASRQVSVDKKK